MKTSEFLNRFCSQGRYSETRKRIAERFSHEEDIPEFQNAAGLDDSSTYLLPLVETAAAHEYPPLVFGAWVKTLGEIAAYWNLATISAYVEAGVPPEYVSRIPTKIQTEPGIVLRAWENNLAPEYVF